MAYLNGELTERDQPRSQGLFPGKEVEKGQ